MTEVTEVCSGAGRCIDVPEGTPWASTHAQNSCRDTIDDPNPNDHWWRRGDEAVERYRRCIREKTRYNIPRSTVSFGALAGRLLTGEKQFGGGGFFEIGFDRLLWESPLATHSLGVRFALPSIMMFPSDTAFEGGSCQIFDLGGITSHHLLTDNLQIDTALSVGLGLSAIADVGLGIYFNKGTPSSRWIDSGGRFGEYFVRIGVRTGYIFLHPDFKPDGNAFIAGVINFGTAIGDRSEWAEYGD